MHTIYVSFMTRTKRSYLFHAKVAHLRKPKTVLDSVSHAVIPGTRFQNLCRRNLDSGSNRKWGLGFLTLSCGFQSLGFRIRKIKFYGFQILQATIFQIPESGFSYMGRDREGGGAGRAAAPPLFCAPAPTFCAKKKNN